jgi:hypothetical protein
VQNWSRRERALFIDIFGAGWVLASKSADVRAIAIDVAAWLHRAVSSKY